jgi:RNA-directed DNA polymerase
VLLTLTVPTLEDKVLQRAALRLKLKGHYAYYGITGNARALARFLYEVRRLWRKWLNRRSWRARMTWEKFARLTTRYPLPQPRVVHSVYRRVVTP